MIPRRAVGLLLSLVCGRDAGDVVVSADIVYSEHLCGNEEELKLR